MRTLQSEETKEMEESPIAKADSYESPIAKIAPGRHVIEEVKGEVKQDERPPIKTMSIPSRKRMRYEMSDEYEELSEEVQQLFYSTLECGICKLYVPDEGVYFGCYHFNCLKCYEEHKDLYCHVCF